MTGLQCQSTHALVCITCLAAVKLPVLESKTLARGRRLHTAVGPQLRTSHALLPSFLASTLAQYVDLFSKDFIFVPIHEALHWSLAIICHPGNWHGRRGHGTACILHLDSMADGGWRG
jgi:hypothetical protein